jgi:hypothetical protein
VLDAFRHSTCSILPRAGSIPTSTPLPSTAAIWSASWTAALLPPIRNRLGHRTNNGDLDRFPLCPKVLANENAAYINFTLRFCFAQSGAAEIVMPLQKYWYLEKFGLPDYRLANCQLDKAAQVMI